jgi:1A family penicillin-binding protein
VQRAVLVIVVVVIASGAWFGGIRAATILHGVVAELDRAEGLAALHPRAQATIVFDRHGRPAFSFFVEQRVDVPLESVSPQMIDALLAIEDRRFYRHNGIDPIRVAGAAWQNLRARRIVQGGSTITQQLARAAQLTPERTYTRKMHEVMIAARIEERYSKDEILEQYLNTVYFGEGLYGVEAAARGYFAKPASDLALHEAALLAALVRSPSNDGPYHAPGRALARRNLVLRLMHREGRIDAAGLRNAVQEPLPDRSQRRQASGVLLASARGSGLYFQEELRRQLVTAFGDDRVLRGGLRVYSTFDSTMQRAAEEAIGTRIERIVRSRPRARDLQGSLVALDPATGDVLALVGGRSFNASSFNRATQARRQPGSAFKPIVFAAALERGYGPGSLLRDLDAPIDSYGAAWLPSGEHERPEYTLRRALRVSSNRAAAQLMQQIGVGTAIYYANRLGIDSRLPIVPSLALGTGEVTLLELTTAYTAFANRGLVSSPRLFTHVTDSQGALVWEAAPQQRQAISATTAYLMSSMLAEVVSQGTGYGARAAGFRLPAAGKTGTSDDFMDAWFIGYTPHLVAGVWFGFDDPAPIMRDGFAGTIAAPAWGQFMRVATAGARPDWYEMPPDVEKVAICRLSGGRATDACRHGTVVPDPAAFGLQAAAVTSALAGSPTAGALQPVHPVPKAEPTVYEDLFPVGAVPVETCWLHSTSAPSFSDGQPSAPARVDTPLVDAALGQHGTVPVGTSGTPPSAPTVIETGNGTRIVIQRIVGADGVTRTVVKQIR